MNVKITENKREEERISKKEKDKEGGRRERKGKTERSPGITKTLLQRMGLGVQQSRLKS